MKGNASKRLIGSIAKRDGVNGKGSSRPNQTETASGWVAERRAQYGKQLLNQACLSSVRISSYLFLLARISLIKKFCITDLYTKHYIVQVSPRGFWKNSIRAARLQFSDCFFCSYDPGTERPFSSPNEPVSSNFCPRFRPASF